MSYIETEDARLRRSRALLRQKMRRRKREISAVSARLKELLSRQRRDFAKAAALGAEIGDDE